MAETSTIEWTDATWNPVTGCSVVSPGCTNCYAMRLAGTRLAQHPSRTGLTVGGRAGPVWTGEVRLNESWLDQPLRWRRPRRIFVCAHGDLFHPSVPFEWIDAVFAVMALTPRHTHQVLTKRSDRMREYMNDQKTPSRVAAATVVRQLAVASPIEWPLPSVWLGVSAEDQRRADERIPNLLATTAAVRFVSLEPLLGPIDLRRLDLRGEYEMDALRPLSWREVWDRSWAPEVTGVPLDESIEAYVDEGGTWPPTDDRPRGLDWVIVGGESGPGARPMAETWAQSLLQQCRDAGVPFFMKQMSCGEPIPEHLLVREWPNAGNGL